MLHAKLASKMCTIATLIHCTSMMRVWIDWPIVTWYTTLNWENGSMNNHTKQVVLLQRNTLSWSKRKSARNAIHNNHVPIVFTPKKEYSQSNGKVYQEVFWKSMIFWIWWNPQFTTWKSTWKNRRPGHRLFQDKFWWWSNQSDGRKKMES